MKTAKRYDDYLLGETRKQYVERRKGNQLGTLIVYWPTCFIGQDGFISKTNGTFANPKSQEYERLKVTPQVPDHIKKIDAMFEEKGNDEV